MCKLPDKIRIKDIAALEGVSTGTVDRVLHNRGEVSQKSREKIEKILTELNYQPNIYATALASKKKYTFITLLPEAKKGEYWYDIKIGVDNAAKELLDLNINVQQIFFDQYDETSFIQSINTILIQSPDGVLLAPVFKEQTIILTKELRIKNIPFVFIDSDISELNALSYFGMHSFKSGYLAAKLLLKDEKNNSDIAIFQAYRTGNSESNQTELRINGFKKYISDYYPDTVIHSVKIYAHDTDKNDKILKDCFNHYPQIKKGVTFNSRAYLIADYLTTNYIDDIKLIGYDLLEKNVIALKKNKICYLLAQRPEIQSYKGLKALCEYKIFKNKIKRTNFMPIDILTQENIDFYQEFTII